MGMFIHIFIDSWVFVFINNVWKWNGIGNKNGMWIGNTQSIEQTTRGRTGAPQSIQKQQVCFGSLSGPKGTCLGSLPGPKQVPMGSVWVKQVCLTVNPKAGALGCQDLELYNNSLTKNNFPLAHERLQRWKACDNSKLELIGNWILEMC